MSQAAPKKTPDGDDDLVTRLLKSYDAGPRSMHHLLGYELPQMSEVVRCLDDVRALLFPGFVGQSFPVGPCQDDVRRCIGERLDDLRTRLRAQIYRGLHHRCQLLGEHPSNPRVECPACATKAVDVIDRFLN